MVLLLVILTPLSLLVPYFFTADNLLNILFQSSYLGLMAIGMTLVLIVGGIDLSIPGVMALGAILGVMFMRDGGNPAIGGLIMIGVGVFCGAINGFAVAYLRMIPFIVTLSMQAIAYGTALWVTQAISVSGIHPDFQKTVLMNVWKVPGPVIVLIVIMIAGQLLMRRSIYGRWLYLVGTNRKMARVCGVPTNRVIFSAYVLSGLLAGLAAIILSSRLNSAAASMGTSSVVLDIIGAAVLGGASIYGGQGTAIGAVAGTVLITLISNSMNMMHLSYYVMLFVKGFVIIAFLALDSLRR